MYPQSLTAGDLAKVLAQKVLSDDYRQRAWTIRQKIQAESGLEKACQLIERWLPEKYAAPDEFIVNEASTGVDCTKDRNGFYTTSFRK